MPTLPKHAHIVDVGPRDGLQNEKQMIPADVKVELVDRLTDAGFTSIEVTSFVSPKWVPQMSDAADVMARIRRKPGVTYSVLVPNAKGMEGALAAKADEIVVFAAASEAFSQKNINCSIDESIERFRPVTEQAQQARNTNSRRHFVCAWLPLSRRSCSRSGSACRPANERYRCPARWCSRHDRHRHTREHKTCNGRCARRLRSARGQRPLSRHLRDGHSQRLCVPRARHFELRLEHRRPWWMSVCKRRDRKRGH